MHARVARIYCCTVFIRTRVCWNDWEDDELKSLPAPCLRSQFQLVSRYTTPLHDILLCDRVFAFLILARETWLLEEGISFLPVFCQTRTQMGGKIPNIVAIPWYWYCTCTKQSIIRYEHPEVLLSVLWHSSQVQVSLSEAGNASHSMFRLISPLTGE